MKAFSDAFSGAWGAVTSQRWLMLALAALTAGLLLASFVSTLQDSLKRGEELRQAQRVSSVRQTISTVADAAPAMQTPQLR